jgi:hypothetical protein
MHPEARRQLQQAEDDAGAPTLSKADADIIARGVVKGLAVWTAICAAVGFLIRLLSQALRG